LCDKRTGEPTHGLNLRLFSYDTEELCVEACDKTETPIKYVRATPEMRGKG
jgi:hypothetical protein